MISKRVSAHTSRAMPLVESKRCTSTSGSAHAPYAFRLRSRAVAEPLWSTGKYRPAFSRIASWLYGVRLYVGKHGVICPSASTHQSIIVWKSACMTRTPLGAVHG